MMTTLYPILRVLTVATTTWVVAACAPMKPSALLSKITSSFEHIQTTEKVATEPLSEPNKAAEIEATLNNPLNQVEVEHVPFFPQKQLQCGPAALATVLAFSGIQTSADELSSEVFTPGKEGTLQVDILAGIRRFGLLPYPVNTLNEIIESLKKKKPVIVFLNLSVPIAPKWHYAVIYGFKNNHFLLRSGTKKSEEISVETFQKLWQRGDNWGLIVFEANQDLPRFIQPNLWLQAAIDLEQVSRFDALQFHSTGLSYWPKDERFYFTVANGFYEFKQYDRAIKLLKQAVNIQPKFADAWNNLAELYLKTNQPKLARQAIEQAIALGGPRLQNYLASQEAINNSKTKKN